MDKNRKLVAESVKAKARQRGLKASVPDIDEIVDLVIDIVSPTPLVARLIRFGVGAILGAVGGYSASHSGLF